MHAVVRVKPAMSLVLHSCWFLTEYHKYGCVAGKFVPETAVLEMKANFTLPSDSDEFVDEILWCELDRHEAEPLVGL